MPEFDEHTGYLVIKPGDRVFIEYDDPLDTAAAGGLGTVVLVKDAWGAKILRDASVNVSTYGRHLLREP